MILGRVSLPYTRQIQPKSLDRIYKILLKIILLILSIFCHFQAGVG